ncbi:MAG: gliding motility lipoprotein GldH [Bacteroidetes bacterium]|nr:MAG: gliding motility lipoprotein GldH [Bacteroidota bacterium]TAF92006.1 MAG: gliding motility lipoprotein GldH [Bacteroidota bacterium]
MAVNRIFFYMLALVLGLASCQKIHLYEKTKFFAQQQWKDTDTARFAIDVEDTTVLYNISVVVRHTDAYRYNNIWVNVVAQAPGGKPTPQLLELQLADNAQGWLAKGVDDIYDHRIKISRYPVRLAKGTHQFALNHAMRENPLQHILQAGIRIEKAE